VQGSVRERTNGNAPVAAETVDRDASFDFGDISAAVVGTGFIGSVHVEALRRLGVRVSGVVGSSPERAALKPDLPAAYASFDAMLADADVDVVHLTTPNHLHYAQAKAALQAGKHVVCEKPLATTAEQAAELLELAEQLGLVHATNFNLRFYAQAQQARALAAQRTLGEIWNVHGVYLQDWLLRATDWNWRLEPEKGGELRAVGDIGSHWLDLVQFVLGRRVEAVFADLSTAIPVRSRPVGDTETFSDSDDGERVPAPVTTDDIAHVLLRFEDGARGSVVLSQVSAGRKNGLRFEVDGSSGALAWYSERPEELWLGHRDRPNETLLRNPSLLEPDARQYTELPAGHAEGFRETFKELYRRVYAAVAAGGPPDEPQYPTFADGHWQNVLGEAIARSNREQRWVAVSA
jgi:predicted dehydrogenase